MSWTNECTESNQFKVKNVKEVRQVLENMGFNVYESEEGLSFGTSGEGTFFNGDTEVVLSLKPFTKEETDEPTNFVGIISDYCMESVDLDDIGYGLTKDDIMVIPIVEYLQDQLKDEKEYITVSCAGFESRCSGSFDPFGDVTFITKNTVEFMSLYKAVDDFLKKNNLVE
jgi:hypothetical protein